MGAAAVLRASMDVLVEINGVDFLLQFAAERFRRIVETLAHIGDIQQIRTESRQIGELTVEDLTGQYF